MPSDGKNGERDGGLCDLRVHYRYRPGPGLLAGRAAQVSCVFAIVSVFGNLASRKEKPPRTRHTPRKNSPSIRASALSRTSLPPAPWPLLVRLLRYLT